MPKRFALLVLVCAVAATAIYLRESFYYRTSPLPFGMASRGLVFRDRVRTGSDYNLVFDDNRSPHCLIRDMGGQVVRDFGPGLCHFLSDGSVVFLTAENLRLADSTGKTLWSVAPGGFGDIAVSDDEAEIFILNEVPTEQWQNVTVNTGVVRGYLRSSGEKFFEWSSRDHREEIDHGDRFHEYYGRLEHIVFDSIQILPATSTRLGEEAFKKGHLLLTSGHAALAIVIDPKKNRLSWSHFFLSVRGFANRYTGANAGPYAVRQLADGDLLYLQNRNAYVYSNTEFSSLIRTQPGVWRNSWTYTAKPATIFNSEIWGDVQLTSDGHLLVTNSAAGSAFEITDSGRLLWEWVNPDRDETGIAKALFRVTRVARATVEKTLRSWHDTEGLRTAESSK